mgnify:CR=1 FL=1
MIAPLGTRCALARAIVTSLGTATSCPSPTDWQAGEQAAYVLQDPVGNWAALFHDRTANAVASISMDCWARAASVGAVS